MRANPALSPHELDHLQQVQDARRNLVGRDLQDLPHKPGVHPPRPAPQVQHVRRIAVLHRGEGARQDEGARQSAGRGGARLQRCARHAGDAFPAPRGVHAGNHGGG